MITDPKRAVLVVDNDRSILRVFSRILQKNGYEVVSAESGQMAKEEISRRVFDATLIDVRLPDVKGSELLSIVKERSPETLKIIFTGAPTNELVSGFNVQDLMLFLLNLLGLIFCWIFLQRNLISAAIVESETIVII